MSRTVRIGPPLRRIQLHIRPQGVDVNVIIEFILGTSLVYGLLYPHQPSTRHLVARRTWCCIVAILVLKASSTLLNAYVCVGTRCSRITIVLDWPVCYKRHMWWIAISVGAVGRLCSCAIAIDVGLPAALNTRRYCLRTKHSTWCQHMSHMAWLRQHRHQIVQGHTLPFRTAARTYRYHKTQPVVLSKSRSARPASHGTHLLIFTTLRPSQY